MNALLLALPTVIKVGSELYDAVMKIRNAFKGTAQWTEVEEQTLVSKLDDVSQMDHWQPRD